MSTRLALEGPARLSLGCPRHQRTSLCKRSEARSCTLVPMTHVDLRPRARCSFDVSEALVCKLAVLHACSKRDVSSERCRAVAVTTLTRRYEKLLLHANAKNCYAALPSLYMLLGVHLGVSAELFVDVVNCTGVFPTYFSEHLDDVALFGACGRWSRSMDGTVAAAVANPPFENRIIEDLLTAFNENVTRDAPYFRAAILPITKDGAVMRALQHGNLKGKVVILFPPGHLGFRPYSNFYTYDAWMNSYVANSRIHLSLVMWCNSSHANLSSVPWNFERRVRQWVNEWCREPSGIQIFEHRLAPMFPMLSRCRPSTEVSANEDCSVCVQWNSFLSKQ